LRTVFIAIGVVHRNAGFGGVGHHELQLWLMRQRQVVVKRLTQIDLALHALDLAVFLDRLAGLVQAADQGGVDAALHVQQRHVSGGCRAHDGHTGVQAAALVQQIDLPVDEAAQEVALAELDDADGQGEGCFAMDVLHGVMLRIGCLGSERDIAFPEDEVVLLQAICLGLVLAAGGGDHHFQQIVGHCSHGLAFDDGAAIEVDHF